jgi:hypothetical protein
MFVRATSRFRPMRRTGGSLTLAREEGVGIDAGLASSVFGFESRFPECFTSSETVCPLPDKFNKIRIAGRCHAREHTKVYWRSRDPA